MKKDDAIAMFGNRTRLARGVGVSNSTVTKWPEELPTAISDRIVGACARLGILRTIPLEDFEAMLAIKKNIRIAKVAGVSQTTVSAWKKTPTINSIDRIFGAFIRIGEVRAFYDKLRPDMLKSHGYAGLIAVY